MNRPLSGAAKAAHERKVILDKAREVLTRRDPHVPAGSELSVTVQDTLALLRQAVS